MEYESTVTWKNITDYLRCSPQFHHNPRYDGIMIHTLNGPFFGKLLLVFTIKIEEKEHCFAYIQSFNVLRNPSTVDKSLGLLRVYSPASSPYEFIPIESIIRGAFIVSDNNKPGQAFVLDVIDPDMYLRLQKFFDKYYS